jgi:hypothetical protein
MAVGNLSQRSIAAARAVTARRGQSKKLDTVTLKKAAGIYDVSFASITQARMVLKYASVEELESVEKGHISVSCLFERLQKARKIMDGRIVRRRPRLAAAARRIDRAESLKLNNVIWNHLRTGLNELANLPRPQDVAAMITGRRKSGTAVLQQLSATIKYLKEIEDVCNHRETEESQ